MTEKNTKYPSVETRVKLFNLRELDQKTIENREENEIKINETLIKNTQDEISITINQEIKYFLTEETLEQYLNHQENLETTESLQRFFDSIELLEKFKEIQNKETHTSPMQLYNITMEYESLSKLTDSEKYDIATTAAAKNKTQWLEKTLNQINGVKPKFLKYLYNILLAITDSKYQINQKVILDEILANSSKEKKLENETPILKTQTEIYPESGEISMLINDEVSLVLSQENYETYIKNTFNENFSNTVESLQRLTNSFDLLDAIKDLEINDPEQIDQLLKEYNLEEDLTEVHKHDLRTAANAKNSYQWIENQLYDINHLERSALSKIYSFYLILTDSKWERYITKD
tara:strand:+ start:4635 stop:5678 length:1044 start_codon:yes stop_codon:yes gene_type:complete